MTEFTTSPIDLATPSSSCVYRYYDAYGVLIYVGVTKRGAARNAEHNESKAWWRFAARQEVDHYDSDEEARRNERAAIIESRPPFNKQHNPMHEEIREAYLRMVESRSEQDTGPRSFQDYYQAIGHRLPLTVIEESADGHALTLRSQEEHSLVALACVLPQPVTIRFPHIHGGHRGPSLGVIDRIAHVGPYVFLRGHFKDGVSTFVDPAARLKVVTLKRPIVVRIKYVEASVEGLQ